MSDVYFVCSNCKAKMSNSSSIYPRCDVNLIADEKARFYINILGLNKH